MIVSSARTPDWAGLQGHLQRQPRSDAGGACRAARSGSRAALESGEVLDVLIGASLQQGMQAPDIGRLGALRASLLTSIAGMSFDRQCGSGLMTIATAAKQIIVDGTAITGGVDPDEMGIGPVALVLRPLEWTGKRVEDVGLWELNKVFARQVIYCCDKLGVPEKQLNVDGGAIAIGHSEARPARA
ncbi:hypothetical protein [Sphingomonas bacterium]|nr:hypothetical protein [Sphingomonas bacterium]